MTLIDDLNAFVVAISKSGESKNNKQGLKKIIDKYKNKTGKCMFCGGKLNDIQ